MTESLPTSGFFTSALGAYDGSNPFDTEFRDAEDQRKQQSSNNSDNDGFFFGFSPRTSPVPDMMDSGGQPNGWNLPSHMSTLDLQNFRQLVQPRTTQTPFKEWDVDPSFRHSSSLNKILTQDMDCTTEVQYVQITPLSDSTSDSERGSNDSIRQEISRNPAKRKTGRRRRRSTQVNQFTEPTNSRRRKSSAAAKSIISHMQDNDKETDEKRSKFLERNKTAATKCRQKKKEWTNNLEQRARELRRNKAQLAMMVGCLKEEMLYVKGKVLKHNDCNCTAMREYLNREVQSISQQTTFHDGLTRAMSSGFSGSPVQGTMDIDQGSHPSAHWSRQGSTSAASPVANHDL